MFRTLLIVALSLTSSTWGFVVAPAQHRASTQLFGDGFGKQEAPKQVSEGQKKRNEASAKYDEIAAAGGQEYRIYARPFGMQEDDAWLPCGVIAVPRGVQVSRAIYEAQDALRESVTRTYKDVIGESELEYGFHLKMFKDDPIEVAQVKAPEAPGISFGNWMSALLSPMDASGVKRNM